MTIAEYFIDGSLKSLSSDDRRDGYLKIMINSLKGGNLVIGKKLFQVKNGELIISPRDLSDGEILPKFYTEGHTVCLEGLYIHDKAISPSRDTAELLLELRRDFYYQRQKLSAFEDELFALKQKISKGITF